MAILATDMTDIAKTSQERRRTFGWSSPWTTDFTSVEMSCCHLSLQWRVYAAIFL